MMTMEKVQKLQQIYYFHSEIRIMVPCLEDQVTSDLPSYALYMKSFFIQVFDFHFILSLETFLTFMS